MFRGGVTAYFTVNERTDVTGNYVIDGDCNRYTTNNANNIVKQQLMVTMNLGLCRRLVDKDLFISAFQRLS